MFSALKRTSRSLSFRLTCWHAGLLFVAAVASSGTVFLQLRQATIAREHETVEIRLGFLEALFERDGVEAVADLVRRAEEGTVDAFFAIPNATWKGARVVPSVKNGKPNGFKLYAIRPSSMWAAVGFSNGDTVHAINDFELESVEDALEAYQALKTATSLTIEVTRRGTPFTLNIEITK